MLKKYRLIKDRFSLVGLVYVVCVCLMGVKKDLFGLDLDRLYGCKCLPDVCKEGFV